MEPVVAMHFLAAVVPQAADHAGVGQVEADGWNCGQLVPLSTMDDSQQLWPKWLLANVVSVRLRGTDGATRWHGAGRVGLATVTFDVNVKLAPSGKHLVAFIALRFTIL